MTKFKGTHTGVIKTIRYINIKVLISLKRYIPGGNNLGRFGVVQIIIKEKSTRPRMHSVIIMFLCNILKIKIKLKLITSLYKLTYIFNLYNPYISKNIKT